MSVHKYELILLRRDPPKLTLEMLAAGAGLHPDLVERFVEFGLIEPTEWEGSTLLFEPSAVPRLRMIRRLRETLGINLAGIAVIQDLVDRICAVQSENDALRQNHSESDL